jgi:hypothetical protein
MTSCLKHWETSFLTEQEEWNVLEKLETSILDSSTVIRLRRKLLLRRIKRKLGLPLFDLDSRLRHLLVKHQYTPVMFKSFPSSNNPSHSFMNSIRSSTRVLDRYNVSFGMNL